MAQAQRQVQSDHNADGKARNLCSAKPRAGAENYGHRTCGDDKLEKVQNSGIHQANSSNESDVEKDPYAGFLVVDVH